MVVPSQWWRQPPMQIWLINSERWRLSPAFSAGQTSYAVTVPNSVSSITIGATAADSKATVSGTGAKNLNVGSNKFSVVVKAESGATKTYTVTVTRQGGRKR